MSFKKTIKKIVALSTGATMLGATILGAMAVDLNEFPNPMFIKDGKFDGLIVIGSDADTQDMLGAMDIISSLQAATIYGTTSITNSATATTSIIGDVYKIEKSSNVLNIGDEITNVKSKLTDSELPVILKDGTVRLRNGKEYDYEQEIEFAQGLELKHFSDKDYKDDEPTIGIPISRNSEVFTYTLDFNGNLDVTELEDRNIEILGVTYNIVDATNTSLNAMKGAIVEVLNEGQTGIYTINGVEYEVKVVGIYDNTNKVKFIINGEVTDSLVVGETYEFKSGLSIGVREVLPNEAGEVALDMVQFYLGAKKIIFKDGDELEVDDESIDNVDVTILSSGNTISEMSLTWIATEDLFVTSENDVVMPGLEAVKLYMTGFSTGGNEETSIYSDDEGVRIRTLLKNYDIDLTIMTDIGDNGTFDVLGEDDDRLLITNTCKANKKGFNVTNDVEYFIVSTANGDDSESHVLEVINIDEQDGISVKDYDNEMVAENVEINEDFDVGDMTIEVLDFNEDDEWAMLNITSACDNKLLYTAGGLTISLPGPNQANQKTNYPFIVTEENDNGNIGSGETFEIYTDFNDDDEVEVKFQNGNLSGDGFSEDENGNNVGYINSDIGTKIIEDDDKRYVDITYPSEETNGDVYIGGATSSVTVTENGETNIDVIPTKIEVGAAVLDTSLTNYQNRNLIVIGGPAINKATASLLGKTYPAYGVDSGLQENTGMIKLIEQTDGTVAMIVAGWEAADTQRACRVMAEFENHDLKGNEIVITGTSMSDISVSLPVVVGNNS